MAFGTFGKAEGVVSFDAAPFDTTSWTLHNAASARQKPAIASLFHHTLIGR